MAAEMDPKPVPGARIGDGPAPAADVEPVRPQPDETAIRKPRPLRQRKRGDHVADAQISLHQFRHPPIAACISRTASSAAVTSRSEEHTSELQSLMRI